MTRDESVRRYCVMHEMRVQLLAIRPSPHIDRHEYSLWFDMTDRFLNAIMTDEHAVILGDVK